MSLIVPKGVWKVVRSRNDIASARSSYPTYKSIMLLQACPAKCSASCSIKGDAPECRIVTALSGSKDCMMQREVLSFFTMQNHCDQYKELDDLNMPASILSWISLHTSLWSTGGMGMLRCTQGVCGMMGIFIGGKYSSIKCPLSNDSHANAS